MGNLVKKDLVRHEKHGIGRIEETAGAGAVVTCTVYFPRLDKSAAVPEEELQVCSEAEAASYEMVKLAVYEVRSEELPGTALGARWKGGELVLKPGDAGLASKSIPIETFFHKIVMVRDRLRVLEAQLNGHKVLTDAEKADLQQYITRIYGSLTSFNILFKDKGAHFVGQKGEG